MTVEQHTPLPVAGTPVPCELHAPDTTVGVGHLGRVVDHIVDCPCVVGDRNTCAIELIQVKDPDLRVKVVGHTIDSAVIHGSVHHKWVQLSTPRYLALFPTVCK